MGSAASARRMAKGGGWTRWYLARSPQTAREILGQLRAGSCVSFYFDGPLHVEAPADDQRRRMIDRIAQVGEILVGFAARDGRFEVVELTSAAEVEEALASLDPDSTLVWGEFPPRMDDGEIGFTLDLVDDDGVIRDYPH